MNEMNEMNELNAFRPDSVAHSRMQWGSWTCNPVSGRNSGMLISFRVPYRTDYQPFSRRSAAPRPLTPQPLSPVAGEKGWGEGHRATSVNAAWPRFNVMPVRSVQPSEHSLQRALDWPATSCPRSFRRDG